MVESKTDSFSSELVQVLKSVKEMVVFTGAGISTESGIPDFRSPGGIWSRYKPVQFQDFLNSEAARHRYWTYKKETYPDFALAKPNAGHYALVEMGKKGKIGTIITQNIDGLHQEAGNDPDKILELHGTERWVKCLGCNAKYSRHEIQDRLDAGEDIPLCDHCGGLLKPATISFGQSLPQKVLKIAFDESEKCEAFLVIGSSLQVQPAASLPQIAKKNGAWLGILNRESTPLDDLADSRSIGSAGQVLADVINKI